MSKILGIKKKKFEYHPFDHNRPSELIHDDSSSVMADNIQIQDSILPSNNLSLLIFCTTRMVLFHIPEVAFIFGVFSTKFIEHLIGRTIVDFFFGSTFNYMMGGSDIPNSLVNPPYNRFA